MILCNQLIMDDIDINVIICYFLIYYTNINTLITLLYIRYMNYIYKYIHIYGSQVCY